MKNTPDMPLLLSWGSLFSRGVSEEPSEEA